MIDKEKLKKRKAKFRQTPIGVWTSLSRTGKRKIDKYDFIKWYKKQRRICGYCGVKEIEIIGKKFKCWQIKRLQIDRKNCNKPYQKGNLVLACPVCNFIKGDYFTYEEMMTIGEVIKEIREKKKNQP